MQKNLYTKHRQIQKTKLWLPKGKRRKERRDKLGA